MNDQAVWRGRLERWERSGVSAKVFAAQEGFNASSLFHWKRRFGMGKSTALVPVKVGSPAPPFEVIIDGQITLRVAADFDEAALSRLLQALGAAR